MTRLTVHFSGRVQGVGFRYTASRVAKNHEVAGYVRNLPDRRVELVIEGDKSKLNDYLADLSDVMSGYIREQTIDETAPTGEFASGGLEIRF